MSWKGFAYLSILDPLLAEGVPWVTQGLATSGHTSHRWNSQTMAGLVG